MVVPVLAALLTASGLTACSDEGKDRFGGARDPASLRDPAPAPDGVGSPAESPQEVTPSPSGAVPPPAADAGERAPESRPLGRAMARDTKIMFLHHSTGNIIWEGGVPESIRAHNAAHGTAYAIAQTAYPDGERYPWQNYPYDYWHFWVDGGGRAASYPNATLEELTAGNGLIVFKHCFPVSAIGEDQGSPEVSSQEKTIENYKAQYAALRARLLAYPEHRFIVWTGAALTAASSTPEQGARARAFFTWVKREWDVPGDNIFVFDFFELETEGGNFLLDSYSADGGNDSHPSEAFGRTVAPLFVRRMVDVLEGRGDVGSLTGR